MVDVTEILIHWHAGRSQSQIATSLGLDRKTVKKYVDPAIAAGIEPGGPTRSPDYCGRTADGRACPGVSPQAPTLFSGVKAQRCQRHVNPDPGAATEF